MLFLRLMRWVETHTMSFGDEIEHEFVDYRLPIDLLGPFEAHKMGTMINLRNNLGYVIVKESIEDMEAAVASLFAAATKG